MFLYVCLYAQKASLVEGGVFLGPLPFLPKKDKSGSPRFRLVNKFSFKRLSASAKSTCDSKAFC